MASIRTVLFGFGDDAIVPSGARSGPRPSAASGEPIPFLIATLKTPSAQSQEFSACFIMLLFSLLTTVAWLCLGLVDMGCDGGKI